MMICHLLGILWAKGGLVIHVPSPLGVAVQAAEEAIALWQELGMKRQEADDVVLWESQGVIFGSRISWDFMVV